MPRPVGTFAGLSGKLKALSPVELSQRDQKARVHNWNFPLERDMGQPRPNVPAAVVVEDEWLVRIQIADALADAGWEVVEFATGEDAVAALDSGPPIHLVVTDIRLPGPLTGWDVAERFRARHANVAIIYCSGNPPAADRQVDRSTFLSKPCRMDILLAESAKAKTIPFCG